MKGNFYMKKLLVFILALALCLPCLNGIEKASAVSANVFTIVTNPAENSRTQMNISWHASYTSTSCYVQYTVASDTAFTNAKTQAGTYSTSDYLWFYNRYYGESYETRNTTKFLNYGATLTGLTPDTKYIYRIADGQGGYSDVYTFKTAGENFSILFTSDVHITTFESSKLTRFNATIEYLEKIAGYDIGLHYSAGDMTNGGDRYGFWQTLYSQPVFKKYAYAATVGNHDLFDSMMDDDTAYTQYWKTGKYFGVVNNYPKNSYTHTSSLISSWLSNDGYSSYASQSADSLISVSSGSLSGKQITGAVEDLNGRNYWFNYGGVLFIVFDYYSMTYTSDADAAFAWAESVIDANYGKYDYLVVSEHLNLYTAGSCTDKNYSKYKAFLDANNVDFFLCGDEHAYVRTAPIYSNAATSTANKGTVIIQAPAVTNTDSTPTLSGSYGSKIQKRYCKAGYMGGCVFDVTPEKLTLKVAVSSSGTASGYTTLETVTYNRKTRYREPDSDTVVETGLYTAKSALTVYETNSTSAQALTTVPTGTVIEVNAANSTWGRIRYNGYTGWVNLTDYTVDYATSAVTAPQSYASTGYNLAFADGNTMNIYTPDYGSTISNNSWSFTYNDTITAVRDSTGAYKVTAQNLEDVAKSSTAIPANGCVLLLDEGDPNYASIISTLTVGKYFTVDKNKLCVYPAIPGEANKNHYLPGSEPDLALKAESSYTDNGTYISNIAFKSTAAQLVSAFNNEDVRVTNHNGDAIGSNEAIGTGCVVSLYINGEKVDSRELVITGDIDGSGSLSSSDYLGIVTHAQGVAPLDGCFKLAADINNSGTVTGADSLTVAQTLTTGTPW